MRGVTFMSQKKEEKTQLVFHYADTFVQTNICVRFGNTLYLNVVGAGYVPVDERNFFIHIKQFFDSNNDRINVSLAKKIAEEIYNANLPMIDDKYIPWHFVALKNNYIINLCDEMVFYDPKLFLPFYLDVDYDPNIAVQGNQTPVFDTVLQQVTNGNVELIQRIWEVIGCAVANDAYYKKYFVFQGVSGSGKSTILDIICSLFDRRYITSLSLDKFNGDFGMVNLYGKSIMMNTELANHVITDANIAKLKEASGGDEITSNVKYKQCITFLNRAAIFFATNHNFQIESYDPALLARACVIPFETEIPINERIGRLELAKQIDPERLAIVFKSLAAYKALRARNYDFTGDFPLSYTVLDESGDASVEAFLYEVCTPYPGGQYGAKDLYNCYLNYCNIKEFPPAKYERFVNLGKEEFAKNKTRIEGGQNPVATFQNILLKPIVQVS